jgi:hypothetical protein
MLHEVQNARQVPGEGFRRWFTDPNFDLIVWYGEDQSVEGFQLCYDKSVKERALTWKRGKGFLHEKVDDGEVPLAAKMTPILLPDGHFDARGIGAQFLAASVEMDQEVAQFVLEAIKGYPC